MHYGTRRSLCRLRYFLRFLCARLHWISSLRIFGEGSCAVLMITITAWLFQLFATQKIPMHSPPLQSWRSQSIVQLERQTIDAVSTGSSGRSRRLSTLASFWCRHLLWLWYITCRLSSIRLSKSSRIIIYQGSSSPLVHILMKSFLYYVHSLD